MRKIVLDAPAARSARGHAGLAAVAVLLLSSGVAGGASGAPSDRRPAPTVRERAAARTKLVQGADLLQAGDYAEALAQFQQAYELVPSPKIHFNFGLAYMGLGRNAQAVDAFDVFLAEASDATTETTAQASRYRADLAKKIGQLMILSDVDGATIVVDGRSHGTTPQARPIVLEPGPHLLLVESKSVGAPYTQRFEVAAGATLSVNARLRAPAPEATAPPPLAVSPPPSAPAADRHAPAITPPARDPGQPASTAAPGRRARTAALVTGIAALAAAAAGGVAWVVKEQKLGKFNDDKNGCGTDLPDYGRPGCEDRYRTSESAKRLGVTGFVAGGVLAAASVGLLLWDRGERQGDERAQRTAFACAPSLAATGAACLWRF